MNKKIRAAVLCLLSLGAIGTPVLAEDVQQAGRIDAVYPAEGRIVIDDTLYSLSWTARLQGYRGEAISPHRLSPGNHARFSATLAPAPDAPPVLTELRLITQ